MLPRWNDPPSVSEQDANLAVSSIHSLELGWVETVVGATPTHLIAPSR